MHTVRIKRLAPTSSTWSLDIWRSWPAKKQLWKSKGKSHEWSSETSPLLLIMQKERMPFANNPLVYSESFRAEFCKHMHIIYSVYYVYTWYAIRKPLLTWYLDIGEWLACSPCNWRASISADGQQIFNHGFCTLKASTVNRPIKWRNWLSANGDVEQFCCSLGAWCDRDRLSKSPCWIRVDGLHHLNHAPSRLPLQYQNASICSSSSRPRPRPRRPRNNRKNSNSNSNSNSNNNNNNNNNKTCHFFLGIVWLFSHISEIWPVSSSSWVVEAEPPSPEKRYAILVKLGIICFPYVSGLKDFRKKVWMKTTKFWDTPAGR